MWDGPETDAPNPLTPGTAEDASPSSGATALACHERLGWLIRAMSASDFLAVDAGSYDAARRAVHELNNLAGESLAAWSDGAGRPGIRLTPRGRRLCVAVLTVRAEHERLLARFGQAFAEDIRLLDRVAVRTSARNQFLARVAALPKGTLREEILLELAGRRFIKVAITRESVLALQLKPGVEVIALVKASAVDLCLGGGGKVSGNRNRLTGEIGHIVRDAEVAEIVVDLGSGLTGIALVDCHAAASAKVGQRATLSFQPDAVVLGRVA